MYNKVQHVVFSLGEPSRPEKIAENVQPVMALASFVLAGVAVPALSRWAGLLALAHARKSSSGDDITIETTQKTQRIARSKTTSSSGGKLRIPSETTKSSTLSDQHPDALKKRSRSTSSTLTESAILSRKPGSENRRRPQLEVYLADGTHSSPSLPLPVSPMSAKSNIRPITPRTAGFAKTALKPRDSHHGRNVPLASMAPAQKIKLLRQNYFHCQTQFLTALEDISNHLVTVTRDARLSSLRAELAVVSQDLPAEVDIPVICPATLVDGIASKSRHHRIVRLNPTEATVLNSAEKVPFLLMVEVLRDDFNFEPDTPENLRLLARLATEEGSTLRRRIFDLSDTSKRPQGSEGGSTDAKVDSVFEPMSGDLGSSQLIVAACELPPSEVPNTQIVTVPFELPQRSQSGLVSPRTADAPSSRSSSPGARRMTLPNHGRSGAADQPDFGALATHMRTASQMLAQLELTMGKRPKGEVAAIRAKIIASMQSLEEQSFESEDSKKSTPTFEMIIANANVAATQSDSQTDGMEDSLPESSNLVNNQAGIARMENDQKTGGVQRTGDRDDPSAATFGEAWHVKKERIRKSSPFGWMKNWDVLSVIVKTGADLRQEAFACQLIQVCDKIWHDAGTPVWVKRMRILVTGDSCGLIETITNGVSLHSLKRSLTLATIAAGNNPRGRIATLRDHFVKTFGPPDSDAYKTAEDAFKRSLAAYSIISYVLQLKDRHNGNVLIDNEGHIIHIDFGFMLSNSPGAVGFEAAPFKLTQDYVDVLGGVYSPSFEDYKLLCKQAFQGGFFC